MPKEKKTKIGFYNDDGIFYFSRKPQEECLFGNPEENGYASGVIEVPEDLAQKYFNSMEENEEIERIFREKIREKNKTIMTKRQKKNKLMTI
ncbi:MAG: hypothetical protein ACTSR2_00430 [Candidatus Hodarchaeales archaeon]